MATIDKAKGQAVEEHSLSSFDKKRGKVAAYSAQKHKKYRVVSVQKMERADIHGHIGTTSEKSESTPQTSKRSETMRKMLYGTNRNNHSNRERKKEGKTSENTEHSGIFANSENSVSVSKTITPEIAERMKRAAYLDRLNKDKIKTSAARADSVPDSAAKPVASADTVPHSGYEDKKSNEHKFLSETADSVIPEAKKAITPEMAERMKRAAFIEQKNAEAIRLNRATAVAETEDVPLEHLEQTEENIADVPVEHLEESEEKSPASTYLGNSDKAVFDTYNGEVRAYRAKKAYGEFAKKQKNSIFPNVGGFAVSSETQKAISDAQNVSQTLQSSDSAGSAVLDVSATLAAVEAKKMVKKLAETDLKKKKRVDERMENHGNRFGIGSEHAKEVIKDKDEKIKNTNDKSCRSNEAAAEKQRSSKVGNSHKLREEKQEYAKKQKSKEIRNKRKEIFIKENQKIPGSVCNAAKGGIVKTAVKKKAVSLILGGGAGAIVLPVFLAVLVYILISAFFGWLSPFSYSLAGEDNDPNTGLPTEHNAESKAEIIDGYTLMVKNYLDVAQAYYYLNYGDWYGGVYVYESAGLDFGTFFADHCQDLVAEIQAQYQPLIDQAPNPQAAMAISNAMGEAIRQALANAREAALAEYTELIQSLEDELSPNEHRQHYEVEVGYSSNGVDDATEFSGMPVVGTNHFGNTEINSDLSAEEMLAYVALYKSLITMNPEEEHPDADNPDADDEEMQLNITPQDIMDFFEKTEYIPITTEVTHDNPCTGMNCKRRLIQTDSGYFWEYYCDSDHDNLTGEISACPAADELLEKIIDLTGAEENGIDTEQAQEIIDSYIDMFKKELDIDEGDFRKFGAADNSKAQEFYQKLINGELSGADIWQIDTPIGEEGASEET